MSPDSGAVWSSLKIAGTEISDFRIKTNFHQKLHQQIILFHPTISGI
jgi:hypothetical protein